mmetsp:Transcript_23565/g.36231  ORF Transcript_23565/g.36231 Transcript_23565/m.36231 type:complete len:101 (+) Transcript_23565:152-454(+)
MNAGSNGSQHFTLRGVRFVYGGNGKLPNKTSTKNSLWHSSRPSSMPMHPYKTFVAVVSCAIDDVPMMETTTTAAIIRTKQSNSNKESRQENDTHGKMHTT